MNILFDIGHPAHVHLFKYVIKQLIELDHKVYVIAKDQKSITDLLEKYKIEYSIIVRKQQNIFSKVFSYIQVLWKTFLFVKKYKIDVGIGVSMSLPLVGKLTSMKTISLDDDDQKQTPVFAFFANMADIVLTPEALAFEKRNKRHITHPSYHELAYLHPQHFRVDQKVLEKLGVSKGERFFVLRFNSFTAHHDIQHYGLNYAQKEELLERLKMRGKVFISTEDLDERFESYRLPIAVDEMHSVLFFATMFVGDSQTMTSEAAVLGTPALKCNTFAGKLSIPNELEDKYELCYSFQPDRYEELVKTIEDLLQKDNLISDWHQRRDKMLAEKIDLSNFLFSLVIENRIV